MTERFDPSSFPQIPLDQIDWDQTVEDAKLLLDRIMNPGSKVTIPQVWKALQDCDLPLSDWEMCTEPFKEKIRDRFALLGIFD